MEPGSDQWRLLVGEFLRRIIVMHYNRKIDIRDRPMKSESLIVSLT